MTYFNEDYFPDEKNAHSLLESFLKTKRYSTYLFAKIAHSLNISYFQLYRIKKEDILPAPPPNPPEVSLTPIALKDKDGCCTEIIYATPSQIKLLNQYWDRGRIPPPKKTFVLIKFSAEKLGLFMQEGKVLGFKI